MKKVICIALAILICASLAVPAIAADFVPSITYKGSPTLISKKDASTGSTVVGYVVKPATEGAEGAEATEAEVVEPVEEGCLRIVSVANADLLPEEDATLLKKVYEELSNETMVLPYDKIEGINADKMVVRELLDIGYVCEHDHATNLKEEGIAISLTFNLGVAKDAVLVAMSYVNEEWVPAVELVNNGDGTVTATFEDLCPVVFAIEA